MSENTWAQRARAALRAPPDVNAVTAGQKRQKRQKALAMSAGDGARDDAIVAIGAFVRHDDKAGFTARNGAVIDAVDRFRKREPAHG